MSFLFCCIRKANQQPENERLMQGDDVGNVSCANLQFESIQTNLNPPDFTWGRNWRALNAGDPLLFTIINPTLFEGCLSWTINFFLDQEITNKTIKTLINKNEIKHVYLSSLDSELEDKENEDIYHTDFKTALTLGQFTLIASSSDRYDYLSLSINIHRGIKIGMKELNT